MLKYKVLNIFVVVGCWRSRPWLQNAQTKSLPRQALWYHDGLLEKGICRTTHIWNVTVAAGRFLPDRWKAVQGVGKIRVCNSNVVQSLIQNTTQNLDCWDLFRESMWNVLESDQFPFNHYHYFYFLRYCQFAVNNLIVLYITWSDWKFYLHLEKQRITKGIKKFRNIIPYNSCPFFNQTNPEDMFPTKRW